MGYLAFYNKDGSLKKFLGDEVDRLLYESEIRKFKEPLWDDDKELIDTLGE